MSAAFRYILYTHTHTRRLHLPENLTLFPLIDFSTQAGRGLLEDDDTIVQMI